MDNFDWNEYLSDLVNEDEQEFEEVRDEIIRLFDNIKVDTRPKVFDPQRVHEFARAFLELRYSVRNFKYENLTIGIPNGAQTWGWITIRMKEIDLTTSPTLIEAIRTATTFEVCPRTDGTTDISLTFHDMMVNEEMS